MNQQQCEICKQIYEMNKERLKWYMWRHFSGMNQEDVHDIIQDTWQKLSENIDDVANRSTSEQCNWLTTVCHNRAISFLRTQKKFAEQYDEFDEQIMDAKPRGSLEDEVIEKVMINKFLEKLTEEEKQLLLKEHVLPLEKKRTKSNSENCKTYRLRKKLKKLWKEGGWIE